MQLAEFPLEPRLSKALLSSWEYGCGEEMAVVAAMLSVGEVWAPTRGSRAQRDKLDAAMAEFAVGEGDHITLLNVFRGFEDEPASNGQSPQEWCAENMLSHRALRRACEVCAHPRSQPSPPATLPAVPDCRPLPHSNCPIPWPSGPLRFPRACPLDCPPPLASATLSPSLPNSAFAASMNPSLDRRAGPPPAARLLAAHVPGLELWRIHAAGLVR